MSNTNWFMRHKILTVILALVVVYALASALGGDKSDTATTQPKTETKTEATPEAKKTGLAEFYDKVQNGMTKAEVSTAYDGREPNSCSEMQSDYFGKMETCTYSSFSDAGIVSITYTADKVSNKSKTTF